MRVPVTAMSDPLRMVDEWKAGCHFLALGAAEAITPLGEARPGSAQGGRATSRPRRIATQLTVGLQEDQHSGHALGHGLDHTAVQATRALWPPTGEQTLLI
jgi:hypothetical protein